MCSKKKQQRLDRAARMEIGRVLYEKSIRFTPHYCDGSLRPAWADLGASARWSWAKPRKSCY